MEPDVADLAEPGGDDLGVVERFGGESALRRPGNLRPVEERVFHQRPAQGAGVHCLLLTAVCVAETQEQYSMSTP